ncbi:MAG: hydroxyacylglutathione hydrolase [Salibacteraceae bacterium]|jgi:hydroxyacylglutathione hydrolase
MYVEQLYTGCIAVGTYYIESNGEAIVIDPLRDPSPYMKMAAERDAKITYVILTHFHADFISGHVDLAQKTGATIVYGPTAQADYEFHSGTDGEIFEVGDVTLELMHTPGHTLESSSFLLRNEAGKMEALFTGDALFIGDVGRPDLAIKSDLTEKDLAGMLFDTLRNKIMPLPDEVIIYPNHGAGSSCGKNLSSETFDTLGNQKLTNYALRADMTKEEFITDITTGLTAPPQYFPKAARKNKGGVSNFDDVLIRGMQPISPKELNNKMSEDYLVLDTRFEEEFTKGFIPQSMFIGIDGNFAMWVGAVIENINQKIIIVTEHGREAEVITRLSRVGYDHCVGYLEGGFDAWKNAGYDIDSIENISASELSKLHRPMSIVDVRAQGEWQSQQVKGAYHWPLVRINDAIDSLSREVKHYVHCAGGYRSVIAASIMKRNGFDGANIVNVMGGFDRILMSDLPVTDFGCPSNLLS